MFATLLKRYDGDIQPRRDLLELYENTPGFIYRAILEEGREVYSREQNMRAVRLAEVVVRWTGRHV